MRRLALVRYVVRRWRRSPLRAVASVLTLGLAIGAVASVSAVVNALYFKSLSLPDADRLVRVYARRPAGSSNTGFSVAEFQSLLDRSSLLTGLAAEHAVAQLHLVSGSAVAEAQGAYVSAGYFRTMGVAPLRGRLLSEADVTTAGRDAVAVIGERLWRRELASIDVVGTQAEIDGLRVRIVGVIPAAFAGDDPGNDVQIWMPLSALGAAGRACSGARDCASVDWLVGRLGSDATPARAEAEMSSQIRWSPDIDPPNRRRVSVEAMAGADPETRELLRPQMLLLAVASVMLLIVACANLAGLSAAASSAEQRDMAVRLAIGASRTRVVALAFADSATLAAAGAAVGAALATVGVRALAGYYQLDAEGFKHTFDFSLDRRVLLCILAAAAICTGLVGMVPAIGAVRAASITDLKLGVTGPPASRGRIGPALLVGQIAVALALLVSSGLLSGSARVLRAGANFDPNSVIVFRVRPGLSHESPARAEALARSVSESLRATPGILAAGMMIGGEGLVWTSDGGEAVVVSAPSASEARRLTARAQDVDPGFFDALKIQITRGRAFADRDDLTAPPVIIVNQALAAQFWPGADPVGRQLSIGERQAVVIGVAADLQPAGDSRAVVPRVYRSFWQTDPRAKADLRFAVRVAGDPANQLPAIRAAVRRLDRAVPFGEDMPLTDQIALRYGGVFLASRLVTFCALCGLVLSAMGTYSLVAFLVRQRTREIGLRIALGAAPGAVTRHFVGLAVRVGAAGIALGSIAAVVAANVLGSWLYGASARDPAPFAVGATILMTSAVLAGYLPSRRAARVDPLRALRDE